MTVSERSNRRPSSVRECSICHPLPVVPVSGLSVLPVEGPAECSTGRCTSRHSQRAHFPLHPQCSQPDGQNPSSNNATPQAVSTVAHDRQSAVSEWIHPLQSILQQYQQRECEVSVQSVVCCARRQRPHRGDVASRFRRSRTGFTLNCL